MGFLQQFHLFIKYKKGIANNLVNMLSSPPKFKNTYLGTFMNMDPFTHDAYTKYEDVKDVFQQLKGQIHVEEGGCKFNYHL
jgi:hypothetical protein